MVEHSLKILASEYKAITIYVCSVVLRKVHSAKIACFYVCPVFCVTVSLLLRRSN